MGYLVLKKLTYFVNHGQFTFSPFEKQNNQSFQFSLHSLYQVSRHYLCPHLETRLTVFILRADIKKQQRVFYPLIHFFLPTYPLLTSSWKLFTHTLQHDTFFDLCFQQFTKQVYFALCCFALSLGSQKSPRRISEAGSRIQIYLLRKSLQHQAQQQWQLSQHFSSYFHRFSSVCSFFLAHLAEEKQRPSFL